MVAPHFGQDDLGESFTILERPSWQRLMEDSFSGACSKVAASGGFALERHLRKLGCVRSLRYSLGSPTKGNPVKTVLDLDESEFGDFVSSRIWNPYLHFDRMKFCFRFLVVCRVDDGYELIGRYQFGELELVEGAVE